MGYSEMGLEAKDEEIGNNNNSHGTHYFKLLENILRNAYRLNRLLEDFLSVTRIENNLLILEKENVNIYDFVKNIIDDLQEARNTIDHRQEKRKNISTFLEDQHFEADPIVNVDKMKIYQVLTNLTNNALRFSESNQGITLSMKIIENEPLNEKEGPLIDFSNTGFDKNSTGYLVHKHDEEEKTPNKITKSLIKKTKSSIVIRVKDKGKGIDKKILPNLFEKFVTDSRYGSGAGLGLYISKRIIEIHGGKIWAENNRDEPGATFSFSLPLVN
jgi:signal transduction histidine kinase